ncbi:MAG TPA: hypothetical protein GX730_08125 [Chloroflexi bacterium]|jgi:hypothetical protein|nr:hypothetical protein [Chloroflexota bacterium]
MRRRSLKKRKTGFRWALLSLGLAFFLASLLLGLRELRRFQAEPALIPAGTTLGGVPVGRLSLESAKQRLLEAFAVPVELHYLDARIQFSPSDLGFNLDADASLAQIPLVRGSGSWWDFIWNKKLQNSVLEYELIYSLDEVKMQSILEDTFSLRYNQPASAPVPVLYSTNFLPGQPGYGLSSFTQTLEQVKRALLSPTDRILELRVTEQTALPLDWQNLESMLKQIILLDKFDGLAEVYLRDLQSDQMLHFAVLDHQPVPVDVAYSAASTIKIPIMLSTLRRVSEPIPQQANNWMQQMIAESLNPPADGLMKAYLDNNRGPLMVTADLRELGYQNTFLAGYFEPGSPLLERITTPANSRTDINLDPDFYNQTVPSEAGDLLARIYACANSETQTGLFNSEVTPTECSLMIEYLKQNKILALLEAGLPPNTPIAHKHGWTNELDGLIHTMSDTALIFTPGGDYVLAIFAHTPEQFLYDPANRLFARLSQSIYNAYNPENQAYWYEN